MNCKDPLVKSLKKIGYNLVLLPKDTIHPLAILVREERGFFTWLKDLFIDPMLTDVNTNIDRIFIANSQTLPSVIPSIVPNEITSGRSSNLGLDISLDLMLNFLELPKKSLTEDQKAKIKAAFNQSDKFSIAIDKSVSAESVSTEELDSFLMDAIVRDSLGHTFREFLEHNQIYIVTGVIKSNSFTIQKSEDADGELNVVLPKIQDILKGKIQGNLEMTNQSTIKYKGERQLVFGFKAVKLLVEVNNGQYRFKIKSNNDLAVMGDENFPAEYLEVADNFIKLDEEL